jgi:hypothetical protein
VRVFTLRMHGLELSPCVHLCVTEPSIDATTSDVAALVQQIREKEAAVAGVELGASVGLASMAGGVGGLMEDRGGGADLLAQVALAGAGGEQRVDDDPATSDEQQLAPSYHQRQDPSNSHLQLAVADDAELAAAGWGALAERGCGTSSMRRSPEAEARRRQLAMMTEDVEHMFVRSTSDDLQQVEATTEPVAASATAAAAAPPPQEMALIEVNSDEDEL